MHTEGSNLHQEDFFALCGENTLHLVMSWICSFFLFSLAKLSAAGDRGTIPSMVFSHISNSVTLRRMLGFIDD